MASSTHFLHELAASGSTYAASGFTHHETPRQTYELLLFVSSEQRDAGERVHAAITTAVADAFATHTGDAADTFEIALQGVNDAVRDIPGRQNVHSVLGVLVGGALHFSISGRAELYLIRQGNFSAISDGLAPEPGSEDLFANIASGTLAAGDTLLAATTRLLRYVSKNEIVSHISSNGLDAGIAAVLDSARLQHSGHLAVAGVGYAPKDDTIVDLISATEQRKPRGKELRTPQFRTDTAVAKMARDVLEQGRSLASKLLQQGGIRQPRSYQEKKQLLLVGLGAVAVILIFSLVVSSVYAAKARKEEFLGKKSQVEELLGIAENQIISKENDLARQKIAEAGTLLTEIEKSGLYAEDVAQLRTKIANSNDLLDGIVRFDTPELYAETTAKNPVRLVFFDAFYVVDREGVYGPFERRSTNVPYKQLVGEQIIAADKFLDQGSIVLATDSSKLVEYKRGSFEEQKGRTDSTFKRMERIRTFGNNNSVYGLNATDGAVWRYPKPGTTYGAAQQYNTSGTVAGAVDIAIDGALYALKKDGTIARFFRGTETPYVLTNMPTKAVTELPATARIYTNENLRNIYITDPNNHRILQLRKNSDSSGAAFANQFVLPESIPVTDIFIRDTETEMYVLSGGQVYVLPI